jgi:DNA-binding NarL/FixJ family response regulator
VPVTTVVAEDEVLLRAGLTELLGRFGFAVCATAGDAPGLVAAVEEHDPQLVVTDVRMPPGFRDEGLRSALALRDTHPRLAVVVLSQYVQPELAAQLLASRAGRGIGYLLKDRVTDVGEFATALRSVAEGGTVVDPDVVRRLLRRRRDPLGRLTPRERDVLELVAEGHSNAAVARRLYISETVVGKHIGSVLAKLGLAPTDDINRRVMAVLTFLRAGPPAEATCSVPRAQATCSVPPGTSVTSPSMCWTVKRVPGG